MNDDTGGSRQRQRRRPRLSGVLAVMVGIALLTAACGSGPSSSSGDSTQAGGSTTHQKEVAYAQCMRSHGVPKFPDPASNGMFVNNGSFQTDSSQYKSANSTCRHLLPNGGQLSQSQQQQRTSQLLKFAQCMRAHGEPKFPDPTGNGLSLHGSGIDPKSPQFQAAKRACQSLMPTLGGTTGTGGGS